MKFKFTFLAASLMVAGIASAQRAPSVSYTVSGSTGAWDLNFSITNNFNLGEGQLYFFGVLLDSGRNIQSSPTNWDPNSWSSWENSGYGGSSTIYNNNWITSSTSFDLPEGSSLSGFVARSTDTLAPTSVQYFLYAESGTYTGSDNFNTSSNPGFEGVARINSVPEPASMFALGLGAIGLLRRSRKRR